VQICGFGEGGDDIAMKPIINVIGASNSGKTTYLEKLIPELRRRGYRVGTIKHDVHGFEIDHEGKDTWRHRKSGAEAIAISSPRCVASIRETENEMSLEELVGRYFWEEDIILTEGYKRSPFPKIEIYRSAVESKPICSRDDHLIAVVTDDPMELEVPSFHFHEVAEVADFIESRYLKDRKQHSVIVYLDGKRLPMKEFVQDFFLGAVKGMLSTLRGWKKAEALDIHIRLEDR
jgi:molybdopterin-guanine dinucleotide biosynthesis protein B